MLILCSGSSKADGLRATSLFVPRGAAVHDAVRPYTVTKQHTLEPEPRICKQKEKPEASMVSISGFFFASYSDTHENMLSSVNLGAPIVGLGMLYVSCFDYGSHIRVFRS